jgi:hypothetical protein
VGQAVVATGGASMVGLGRMILSYPELAADVLAGRPLQRGRVCRTFSDCTTAPRNGLVSGCYPLDPFYKEHPQRVEPDEGEAPSERPLALTPHVRAGTFRRGRSGGIGVPGAGLEVVQLACLRRCQVVPQADRSLVDLVGERLGDRPRASGSR